MNIIFCESLEQIPNKYTVLELDQLKLPPEGKIVTSYCVVEKIPLEEMPLIEHYRDLHQNCVQAYKNRQWSFCEQAIESLQGKWNRELDSFYENLLLRVQQHKAQCLPDTWDGVIDKMAPTPPPVAK